MDCEQGLTWVNRRSHSRSKCFAPTLLSPSELERTLFWGRTRLVGRFRDSGWAKIVFTCGGKDCGFDRWGERGFGWWVGGLTLLIWLFFFLIFDQGKDGTSGWVGGLTLWETTLRPIEQSIAHDGSALDRGLMQKWFQITIYQLDINQGSELLLKLQPSAGHKSPCCLSCLVKSKLQLSSYRSWNKTTLANLGYITKCTKLIPI